MQLVYHQTHHTIGDFDAILTYIEQLFTKGLGERLHLFPELFLTGYPLQDLCLQQDFINRYQKLLAQINELSQKNSASKGMILLGGLNYKFDDDLGVPQQITNVIFSLCPGADLQLVYTKQLLPNYDIFDEKKYFSPGSNSGHITFQDQKIALLICEDMWTSTTYECDPIDQLNQVDQQFDVIVNLSASPFNVRKHPQRIKRATEISTLLQAPFVYINKVGAEDEIIFDGGSFMVNGEKTTHQGSFFKAEQVELQIPPYQGAKNLAVDAPNNSWEALFSPSLDINKKKKPTLTPLSDQECELILDALCFSIQDYARKCGFTKFTIALSGGIDSTLVLAIVKRSLKTGQYLEAIYMPGLFSAGISHDLSLELCKRLQVPMSTLPIKFTHKAVRNLFEDSFDSPLTGLGDENIQSRLRGAFLYARSNQINSMVLNTSNKSELAVGYSTLYGDSVGALSVLGDLYKSEVFQLSRYINKRYGEIIPSDIIDRPPSAELRENQEDSQTLPPYDELDAVLEGILSYRHSVENLVEMGHKRKTVEQIFSLWKRSEFKRNQFCPIIKLKQKSFGFGYRIPICKTL